MTPISIQRLMGACAFALASLLSACGGTSSTVNPLSTKVNPSIANARIVAFGDGFNDVGARAVGLRYTVNDGSVGGSMTVAERFATVYGFSTITPVTLTTPQQSLSGGAYSYAQGEARVSATAGGSPMPLADQVTQFLANNTPGDNDLIIITAGTRDIIYNAKEYFSGRLTADQAKANVAQAAVDLADIAKRLTLAGAKHVLIIPPFNVARMPWVLNMPGATPTTYYPTFSDQYNFVQQLSILTSGDTSCGSFGCQISQALVNRYPATSYGQPVLLADVAQYFNLVTGTGAGGHDIYGRNFPNPTGNLNTFPIATSSGLVLTNPDVPVCANDITLATPCLTSDVNAIKTNPNNNNLAWDYATAVFADNYNLTPAANRMMADYIYNSSMYRAAWR